MRMLLITAPALQHFHDGGADNHKTMSKMKSLFDVSATVQPPTHHPPTLQDPGIGDKIVMMLISVVIVMGVMTMMMMMMMMVILMV